MTRFYHGQCFVAGTPVTVSSLPDGFTGDEALGLAGEWLARHSWSQAQGPSATLAELETGVSVKQMIERVPLGARVPALNPLRWDYDSTFAEPEESSWAKLTLVMRKRDGGVVDAELLRPRAWIEAAGIAVGKPLPLNLPELNIRDEVSVTAIEACPPIASGAGSVVTARFVTREAHLVASVQLRGPGGELETLTGTELHPIWSVDRADWIPLSQLQPGERLLCSDASTSWDGESERGQAHAIVLGVTLSTVCEPVYNLEIHGEHVYQVGELGVLVHNAGADDYEVGRGAKNTCRHYGPDNFRKKYPEYRGTHEIHHSREWNVLDRYPNTFTPEELNLEEMMRPILRGQRLHGEELHRSHIRKSWDAFQRLFQDRFDSGEITVDKMRNLINRHAEYIDRMYLGRF